MNPFTQKLINAGAPVELLEKWQHLVEILKEMESVAVAFSGGVDSGLICAAAHAALGVRMCAYTIQSPVESHGDTRAAQELAAQVGFRHQVIAYNDLDNPTFVANPPDRCYHCKLARFRQLQAIATEAGFAHIAEGSNLDDSGDYRPGKRAVAELGVRSPLVEAGLSKSEIRELMRLLGLASWDRPSAPCLATRFPYETPVTLQGIEQIAAAEAFLAGLGFKPVRVRYYGPMARVEVLPSQAELMFAQREVVLAGLKKAGFQYIAIDLEGYRTGSLNEVLNR